MIQDPSRRFAGLDTLAARHGVSLEAATSMLRALEAGGGTMAQFDHPEFGGMGQWFSSGMVMVGRMNDSALKARVSALCEDLAAIVPKRGVQAVSFASSQSQSSSASGLGGDTASGAADWWPGDLGRPASLGSQNATRYAYFPQNRRLAVEANGHVTVYDTGHHVITGTAQQQGGTSAFVFSGPNGPVSLDELERVGSGTPDTAGAPEPRPPEHGDPHQASPHQETPRSVAPPASRDLQSLASAATRSNAGTASLASAHGQPDILTILERLAELHRKGVLTDGEFSAKKTELLARL